MGTVFWNYAAEFSDKAVIDRRLRIGLPQLPRRDAGGRVPRKCRLRDVLATGGASIETLGRYARRFLEFLREIRGAGAAAAD